MISPATNIGLQQVGAKGITMNIYFIIEQQFRAEESLFSDSTYNELLFINLAMVPGRRNSISPPAASRNRCTQAYKPVFTMTKLSLTFIVTMALFACGQRASKTGSDTIKDGNKITTFSTDTGKLSKLIDITIYKPIYANFKYIVIDNSGQNERLSVPGPSDSYLQAVLYFDTTTFSELKKKFYNTNYQPPNFNKQNFSFEWLDNTTRNELLQSDTGYYGDPDCFLGLGTNGKLWFLKNKVLLTKATN